MVQWVKIGTITKHDHELLIKENDPKSVVKTVSSVALIFESMDEIL